MPSSRRGEAHLWLLLEEALARVRRGGEDVAEVRRSFHAVAGALAAAEVVPSAVARSLQREFADVLAVRRLVPIAEFVGRGYDDAEDELPEGAVVYREPSLPPPPDGATVWLEAEIERHLDLLASFRPDLHPSAGTETLRILSGPIRAFEAARALGGEGRSLVADLVATLSAVGYSVRRPAVADAPQGRERQQWSAYLRSGRPPLPVQFEPDHTRSPSMPLGEIRNATVRISTVSWTDDAIEVILPIRHPAFDVSSLDAAWICRIEDEHGALHLGQASRIAHDGGSAVRCLVRPGMPGDASEVELRVTSGGRRLEAVVPL